MAHYPQSAVGLNAITYPAGPSTGATLITAGAGNTKGSYTEMVSSTPFTCTQITVEIAASVAGGRRHLLDIAIGGAGAEVVILPDLLIAGDNTGDGRIIAGTYTLPISIPSGTRIAARMQSSVGASTISLCLTLVAAGGTPSPTSYTNAGANTTDSGGVTVDPGGSANTKGSYVEISSGLASTAQILLLMVTGGGNSAMQICNWLVDLATGGAGSETVLIPDIPIHVTTAMSPSAPGHTFLTYIPAGTRVAVRASCGITDATDRLLDVAILTATAPSESSGGSLDWAPISIVAAAGASLLRAVASGAGLGRS